MVHSIVKLPESSILAGSVTNTTPLSVATATETTSEPEREEEPDPARSQAGEDSNLTNGEDSNSSLVPQVEEMKKGEAKSTIEGSMVKKLRPRKELKAPDRYQDFVAK